MAQNVWLRYVNDGTPTSARLYASVSQVAANAERDIQRALDGTDYDMLLSTRSIYTLEVGADQLQNPTSAAFMAAFWTGQLRYISFTDSETEPDDVDFIAVTAGDGNAPVSYLSGITAMPEYSLTLTEKYSSL